MFKAGYIVFFILLISVTCFAEDSDSVLSVEEREAVRSSLYFLLEVGETEIKYNEKLRSQRDLKDSMRRLFLHVIESVDEEEEEEEEEEEFKEARKSDKSKAGKSSVPIKESKWEIVLNPENSSYVKTLFQNEERLQRWIEKDAEPIYFAIQFDNLDMIRFFVETSGMINAAREATHFSPLHFAILTRRLHIIKFFLDHPATHLGQKSIWGDNLFHFVFLSGGQGKGTGTGADGTRSSKLSILRLLLQAEYFSRIFYLLNTPNYHNETALDFAYRDLPENAPIKEGSVSQLIIELLKDKGALTFKDLIKDKRALALTENGIKRTEDLCATHFSSSRFADGIQSHSDLY